MSRTPYFSSRRSDCSQWLALRRGGLCPDIRYRYLTASDPWISEIWAVLQRDQLSSDDSWWFPRLHDSLDFGSWNVRQKQIVTPVIVITEFKACSLLQMVVLFHARNISNDSINIGCLKLKKDYWMKCSHGDYYNQALRYILDLTGCIVIL